MLQTKTRKKINCRNVMGYFLLFCGNIVLFLTVWLLQKYDDVRPEQLMFQIRTPVSGVDSALVSSASLRIIGFSILLLLLEIFLFRLFSGRLRLLAGKNKRYRAYCEKGCPSFLKKLVLPFGAGMLLFSVSFLCAGLRLPEYLYTVATQSDFIEDHYVDPNSVSLTFPEEKKNLVYIILESVEATFSEGMGEDYIPELTALAHENINFSNGQGIGGAMPFTGTTWTAGSMVSQTSGVVIKVPLQGESYEDRSAFLPGVFSVGEILQKHGYSRTLLMGSDAAFANRDVYFTQNGEYDILDIKALKEQNRLPQDYDVWWGYEDEKLFAFAKEELTRLSGEEEPFCFTMLTADTHFPDGYRCRLCEPVYDSPYGNVLRCSSRQTVQFVKWIQEQPFYENTVIVISGDHLTMDPHFLEDLDPEFQRTVYNCFIHANTEPAFEKGRVFGTFDLFPTTLAAMGVDIPGNRLGLGTNLFSDTQTLAEKYGYEVLNKELQKKSGFYDRALLQQKKK